jgi:hypothetical protein
VVQNGQVVATVESKPEFKAYATDTSEVNRVARISLGLESGGMFEHRDDPDLIPHWNGNLVQAADVTKFLVDECKMPMWKERVVSREWTGRSNKLPSALTDIYSTPDLAMTDIRISQLSRRASEMLPLMGDAVGKASLKNIITLCAAIKSNKPADVASCVLFFKLPPPTPNP